MSENEEKASRKSRLTRWAYGLAGIAAAITGAGQVSGAVTLPGCDNSDITQTVREIVKEKTDVTVSVSNETLVSEAAGEKTCSAHIAAAEGNDAADITYRVYWDGWSKMVEIKDILDPA